MCQLHNNIQTIDSNNNNNNNNWQPTTTTYNNNWQHHRYHQLVMCWAASVELFEFHMASTRICVH